jgi:hypothetical protein
MPDLRLEPLMRDPTQHRSALDPIRARFGTLLGDLESSFKKKGDFKMERKSQYFDVAVDAVRPPGHNEIRYRFSKVHTAFMAPK